jgi:hypothetical protein
VVCLNLQVSTSTSILVFMNYSRPVSPSSAEDSAKCLEKLVELLMLQPEGESVASELGGADV